MKAYPIRRREEALARQEQRNKKGPSEQLGVLKHRPGKSVKETTRLRKQIEKNTSPPLPAPEILEAGQSVMKRAFTTKEPKEKK